MQDMAILTGGRFVAEELGLRLEGVTPNELGSAKRVVIDKDGTTIIGGAGSARGDRGALCGAAATDRGHDFDFDREKLKERLAKLAGGVAVIRVGAPTEAELKSRKEAFDDAISATRAATAEGIVPGAGLSLLRAIEAMEQEAALHRGRAHRACRSSGGPLRCRRGRSPRTRARTAAW